MREAHYKQSTSAISIWIFFHWSMNVRIEGKPISRDLCLRFSDCETIFPLTSFVWRLWSDTHSLTHPHTRPPNVAAFCVMRVQTTCWFSHDGENIVFHSTSSPWPCKRHMWNEALWISFIASYRLHFRGEQEKDDGKIPNTRNDKGKE